MLHHLVVFGWFSRTLLIKLMMREVNGEGFLALWSSTLLISLTYSLLMLHHLVVFGWFSRTLLIKLMMREVNGDVFFTLIHYPLNLSHLFVVDD